MSLGDSELWKSTAANRPYPMNLNMNSNVNNIDSNMNSLNMNLLSNPTTSTKSMSMSQASLSSSSTAASLMTSTKNNNRVQNRNGNVSLSVLLAHIGHKVDDISLDSDFKLKIQPWFEKDGKRPDAFRIYLQLTDMVMVWYDVLVKGIRL